ncbi:T9SS-dependent choice-of-anchor J family protein [Chryseobacterium pennipullorum]|uniref:T9SS C-terminal target domain-containing protein n=1 Tax=Chryseobacterium pennipullorum TaxID=2258963 RepID=A0A3D9APK5_9FLAO|nr:choice-of-anchor J domain-containing protein [Chryseobacterium pennipullorum]REC43125.1 T9SS C-terminal target domain-containing protein [Chryseobacterium pennipullorum]
MKKIILSLSLLWGATAHSQTVLLDEGFESYPNFAISGLGNWLTLDLDGAGTFHGGGPVVGGVTDPSWTPNWPNASSAKAFQIFNLTASNATNNLTVTPGVDEEIRDFTAHGGQKFAGAWAASAQLGTIANNDWLISPAVALSPNTSTLTFWVKALSPDYDENYRIGVYVGNGTPTSGANFTIISGTTPLTATYPAWQQVTYNLDAYAGQSIRIGFHYMSENKYLFMLDDVKITTTGNLATHETVKANANTSVYPNPTKGEINIKTDKKIKTATLSDISGKVVTKTGSDRTDISSLQKGTYIMQIEFTDGTTTTEKIIKH